MRQRPNLCRGTGPGIAVSVFPRSHYGPAPGRTCNRQTAQSGRLIHACGSLIVAITRLSGRFRRPRAPRHRGCRARTPRSRRGRTACIASTRMTPPATIVGARSGCRPVHRAALARPACAASSARIRSQRASVSRWPSTRVAVVGLELQVDRGERRRRAGHRDALACALAHVARAPPPRARRARPRGRPPSSAGVGGSVCRKRSVWRTEPSCVDTKNSTPSPAPTTISVLPPPMSSTISGPAVLPRAGRAQVGEPRLPLARDRRAPRSRSARAARARAPRRWRRRARRS